MPEKANKGIEKSNSLGRIEHKIDEMSLRTKGVESKVDELSLTTKGIETKVDELSLRTNRFETKVDEWSSRTKGVETKVDELSSRMNSMEVKVDGWISITKGLETKYDELKEIFAFFRDDMFSHFDTVYKKLDFHKDEYHAITYGMRRIEDEHKIIDHRTILDRLNKLESRN